MICQKCNNSISDNSTFCSYCGEMIEFTSEEKICPSCHCVIENTDAIYCIKCGCNLTKEENEEQENESQSIDFKKNCSSCGYLFNTDHEQFCPKCGKKREIQKTNCPICNTPIVNPDNLFCSVCGCKYDQQSITEKVKNDIQNSNSLNKIKSSASNYISKFKTHVEKTKKKTIAIISIVLFILLALIIVLNIHTCDDCGEIYFGTRNKESFWGETYYVCDDCYDFYW